MSGPTVEALINRISQGASDDALAAIADTLSQNEVNYVDSKGRSLLMFATSITGNRTIATLCGRGADVNYTAGNGATALLLACHKKNSAAIETLLYYGANASAKLEDGTGAIELLKGQAPDLSTLLLERGASLPEGATFPCTVPDGLATNYSKPLALPAGRVLGRDAAIRIGARDDTLGELENGDLGGFINHAQTNHQRWAVAAAAAAQRPLVEVIEGDWGDITQSLSQQTGQIYAVLNMANSRHPGGGYEWGAGAQEENMFYRTSCHFHIDRRMDTVGPDYTLAMTDLIEARNGVVYFDIVCPRVCIKGSEVQEPTGTKDRNGNPIFQINDDVSYRPYNLDQYFLFYEMRAAADDLNERNSAGQRTGSTLPFNEGSMERKILAQFQTLKDKRCRRAVLSAFGCGAFSNPAVQVAGIYRDIIRTFNTPGTPFHGAFDHIVFAIYTGSNVGATTNFKDFCGILGTLSTDGITVSSTTAANKTTVYGPKRGVRFNPANASVSFNATAPPSAIRPLASSASPESSAQAAYAAIVGAATSRAASPPYVVAGPSSATAAPRPAAPNYVVGAATRRAASPPDVVAGPSSATSRAASPPYVVGAGPSSAPPPAAIVGAAPPAPPAAPPAAIVGAAPPAAIVGAAPPAPPAGAPPAPPTGAPPTAAPGSSLYNVFLKNKAVDPLFRTLVYNKSLTIASTEAPYFSLLCQPLLPKIDKWLTERPIDASIKTFPVVTGTFAELTAPSPAVLTELQFLEHQCLAFSRGPQYYVSEYAKLYYEPNGVFSQLMPGPPPAFTAQYPAKMGEVATLFLTYVLPGQFWLRYYILYPLPTAIATRQALNKELADIEFAWNSMYQQAV